MKYAKIRSIMALCLFIIVTLPQWGHCSGDDWKKEFEDICSKTEDSMTLTVTELKQLVERCDKLKPAIEGLDESSRKVFRKRLKLCRDLYDFVLKTKEQEKK